MPWQAVPPLIVIAGAFTVTGVLLRFTDEVAFGKVSFKFFNGVESKLSLLFILSRFSLFVYNKFFIFV